MTTNTLDIPADEVAIPTSIAPGQELSLKVRDFGYPSSRNHFVLVQIDSGCDKGKTRFMKVYDSAAYNGDPTMPREIPPAVMEHEYLEAFGRRGCSVPDSQVIGPYRLAMGFHGTKTLTDRLTLNREPLIQETIFGELVGKQVEFARAGMELSNSLPTPLAERTRKIGDVNWKIGQLYDYWRPGDARDDRARFIDQTGIFGAVKITPGQLVLGDLETYHVLDDGTFVDFESLREGVPAQDLAGLWLSPVSTVGYSAINRLLQRVVELRRENGRSPEQQYTELRRAFQLAAPIDLLRRLTANRRLEVNDGEVFKAFISRYPGFSDAKAKYKERIEESFAVSRENGLFSAREKKALDTAEKAINELVSE